VDFKNLPSAEIITKEKIYEDQLAAYNVSYYLGKYIRD
jgi:hypothetical protein